MSADTDTLESMCELVVDCPHSTPKWTDDGIIVLRNQNIKNGVLDLSTPSFTNEEDYQKRIKRAVPQAGDIIFTREAPMGEVCIIPKGLKCCLGQRQVLLRPKSNVCGEYLFWALQSPFVQHQISWNEGTGSTVSNVRIPVLKALNIPRHHDEEEHIAKVLSDLAGKIEINRQTNQTLEHIAQAIFKSWFVDFEPTRAKIAAKQAGQDRERAAIAAISGKPLDELDTFEKTNPEKYQQLKTTAALFPDALVDSELGEIPEGWDITNVGECVSVTKGRSYKSAELQESSTALVTLKSFMRGGGYREDGLKEYTGTYKPEQVIEPGELVMSLTDVTQAAEIVGKPAIVTRNDAYETLVASLDVAILRPNEAIKKEFFYGLMSTYRFHRYAESFATGTTVLHLNAKGITSFEYAQPANELCKIYSEIAGPMLSKHEGNIHLSRNLEHFRDALLPKLLAGELTIPSNEVA